MSDRVMIPVGSEVKVEWADRPPTYGTLIKRPQDTGDSFAIRDLDGTLMEWNPNAAHFTRMICITELKHGH